MTDSKQTEQFEIYPLPPIQREIIRQMATRSTARYSELKPEDTDSNLYTYHLNELIKEGYISKTDKTYSLTTIGRRYAGIISTVSGLPQLQPKVVVTVALKNESGEYLLYRWQRQPFIEKVSLPYGKMHFGASVLDMAKAELKEKTNLEADLKYRGSIYVKTILDEEILNHMLAHVFEGKNYAGELKSNVSWGECFWGTISEIPTEDRSPGLMEIISLLEQSKQGFFEEIEVRL